jgi:hypothetical protein
MNFLCFFYLSDLLVPALFSFVLLLLLLLLQGGGGDGFCAVENTELIERVYDCCGFAVQGPGKRASSVASTSGKIPTLFKVRSKTRSSFPPFFPSHKHDAITVVFLGFRKLLLCTRQWHGFSFSFCWLYITKKTILKIKC